MTLISFLLQKVKSVEGKGAKVVRIRKDRGIIVQGSDIYIGRKVSNGKWDLHENMWCNPYNDESPEGLLKYENYIRTSTRHWNSLDYLEGRLLGCWCSSGKCHGDVLVKLRHPGHQRLLTLGRLHPGLEIFDAFSTS